MPPAWMLIGRRVRWPALSKTADQQHVAVLPESRSTKVTREPRFTPSLPVEYQVVTTTRRPPMSSVSEESALVEMPWGYHCSSRSS